MISCLRASRPCGAQAPTTIVELTAMALNRP